MAIYSFDTNLLSATKTGTPNLLNTSLSSNGLSVVSLSTDDVGIAFNARTTLNGTLSNLNVQGSVFRVDISYHNSPMAIVKTVSNNIQGYTTFIYSSASSTVASLTADDDIYTPDVRRKWLLGYV